jgi:PPOX class probable F420-dependent enzyme
MASQLLRATWCISGRLTTVPDHAVPTVGGRPWEEFLAERPIAVLATVSADGMPHAVPVEVLVRDGRVYCWCQSSSHKAHNVAREGRAALVAYKSRDGVLVRGPARLIPAGEDGYEEIARAFLDKYKREERYGNDVLIEITPDRVTPMA